MRGAPDGRVVELVTIAHELHQVAPKGDLSEQIKPSVVLEGPKQLQNERAIQLSERLLFLHDLALEAVEPPTSVPAHARP